MDDLVRGLPRTGARPGLRSGLALRADMKDPSKGKEAELMIWSGAFLAWLTALGMPVTSTAEAYAWVEPLAFVAAIVFVIILLAGAYLIFMALRQRKLEDLG